MLQISGWGNGRTEENKYSIDGKSLTKVEPQTPNSPLERNYDAEIMKENLTPAGVQLPRLFRRKYFRKSWHINAWRQ